MRSVAGTFVGCLLAPAAAGSPLRGVKFYDFPDVGSVRGVPHFCVFADPDAAYYEGVRTAVQDLARQEKHRELAFVEIKTNYPDTFKFFNFHPEDDEGLPFAVVVNWTHGMGKKPYEKYAYSDPQVRPANASALQDVVGMERFVGEFFDGQLPPWVRSEQVLENLSDYHPKAGAFQIVESQFSEVVLQENMDVLVMFFAPWCGFSKRMQPRVDDLARRLTHASLLRVVKIDLTMNDVSHEVLGQMTGYPFLAVFPAGKKDSARQIRVEADTDDAAEWRREALASLRRIATHPIPDAPPLVPVEESAAESEEITAFRDLEEF